MDGGVKCHAHLVPGHINEMLDAEALTGQDNY
jgi:hypothetical protein